MTNTLPKRYFRQKYIRSCSAQSVAVIYNFCLKNLYNQENFIDDCFLLDTYPEWREKIDYTDPEEIIPGIRLAGLQKYVNEIFNVKSTIVYGNDKTQFKKKFIKDLKQFQKGKLFLIIDFHNKDWGPQVGHFSPVLDYDPEKGVRIGESGTHNCVWVTVDDIVQRMAATNPDFPGVPEARRGYIRFTSKVKFRPFNGKDSIQMTSHCRNAPQ